MIIFQVPQIGGVCLSVRSVHTGGALGDEGAFHLRKQGQQKERDATRASSAVLSFWSTPWPRGDPDRRVLRRRSVPAGRMSPCCERWRNCGRADLP